MRAAASVVIAGGLLLGTASPAPGGELEGFSIDAREGATATAEYPVGSIPGTDPSGEFVTPADCAELPVCAVVPLTVNYPAGFDRILQEFFLDVVITWDQGNRDVDTGRRVAGQDGHASVQGNDLDIYFYTEKPDPKDPNKMKDTEIGRAATANMPEKARLFGGFDVYDIVISNFSGVNQGFRIDVTFVPAFITAPFLAEDDVVPAFGSTDGGENVSSDGGSSGFLDLTTPGPAASSSGEGRPDPILAPSTGADLPAISGGSATSVSDGAFGDPDTAFDAALAGTRKSASSLFEDARTAGPAEPVGAALLIFWLGIVPLLFAAAAAVVLIRRRPVALSFDIGAAKPA